MKRILIIAMVSFVLTACGTNSSGTSSNSSNAPVDSDTSETEVSETEASETEAAVNEKFKEDSKEYSFVELNAEEVEKMTKVKLVGAVKFVQGEGTNQTFKLETTEDDGFGIYSINNYSGKSVTDGDQITLYGTYNGKTDLSEPELMAVVIE